MDLNLLNTFVAVVEAGSMTQAARRLKQPISRVSRALSRLERDLNQHLILRTTRSFKITSAARVIRSFETPVAILPRVPIEQGIIIIVSNFAEPEAKGALKSIFE